MPVYKAKDSILTRYVDSDFQTNTDSGKSTLGSAFTLNEGVVMCCIIKGRCIVDSTMEVEEVVACKAEKEEVWLMKFLHDLEDAL
ncbi:gag/pol protein [Cucumis melo var. makuwa]|uniref:Gag/pol protein n=1 Tax=Cucumis melo var. makuwa TaxID=1194695 RepID=A0A5A7V160_CUCMM|nr:gag/pol protein [Cucumis melo var. makuwa]TYK00780.1 gag/pol protein [Cucumis melo var. makuwa]